MSIYALGEYEPSIHPDAWVAPNAVIIGKVRLKAGASVWFGTVLRGDNEWIEVGENSNVQENCTLHTDMGYPLSVGNNCTIGHNVLLHGCQIADTTLIGMKSTVMNGAQIGPGCLLAAGSLVTEHKDFTIPGQMLMGSPAVVRKALAPDSSDQFLASAKHYVRAAKRMANELRVIQ